MPNRIIKESICTSDNLNSLTPEEEVFFYRLIVSCDDYGVTDARAPIIRAKCFPLKLDKYSEKQVEQWLHNLVSANLIFMYEVDGRRYLKMTSWESHQQIRAKKSKYPLPDSKGANLISSDINGNQSKSDDGICPRNPIQSNPIRIQSNPIRIQSESNPNPNICANKSHGFTPPTVEKVRAYCRERKNSVDPEKWFDFYSAKGWMIGKNKMKDWKAAVRTWEKNERPKEDLSKKYDYDGNDTL